MSFVNPTQMPDDWRPEDESPPLRQASTDAASAALADENPNCDSTGENAQHAVHKCQAAADHIREMGNGFLALAQKMKTTGDALASDIESRARHFDAMMKSAREYAQQVHGIFEQERGRLADLRLPGTEAKK